MTGPGRDASSEDASHEDAAVGGAADEAVAGGTDATPPPPDQRTLEGLSSDAWAWLLPHVRAALHALPADEASALVERLRSAPTSRLAGGRVRGELHALLARGGTPWRLTVERVRHADPAAPGPVAALLDPGRPVTSVTDPPATTGRRATTRAAAAERTAARARERLRVVREERDELQRQLDGAAARAEAAERGRRALEAELAGARTQLAGLRDQLELAGAEQERAVRREGRRRDAELRRLEETVAELRRAEAERLAARRRRDEAAQQAAARERAAADRAEMEQRSSGSNRLVPGRPSRFPVDVAADTTEAAELLLHAGRLLLVDGYNVSKQHQADLDLEAQRAWLVRTLAALAARRRVRPTVVFDGQQAGSSRPPGGAREVTVVFTPAGVTADDQLVHAGAATPQPLVVVTDDRELTDRLRRSGADVLRTRPFLAAARGS
ncbi:MAG: NYN domain-containing protein [Nitriliruptor sp.]